MLLKRDLTLSIQTVVVACVACEAIVLLNCICSSNDIGAVHGTIWYVVVMVSCAVDPNCRCGVCCL